MLPLKLPESMSSREKMAEPEFVYHPSSGNRESGGEGLRLVMPRKIAEKETKYLKSNSLSKRRVDDRDKRFMC